MLNENILIILVDLSIVIITLFLINKLFKIENENISKNIRKASLMLGYTIAIISVIITNILNEIWYMNILFFLVDTSIIIVFLFISLKLNDKLILHNLNNNEEISNNNVSIAIVESGTILATSIILFASMYGEGSYISSIVFFILGQTALFLMIFLYNISTKFNILELLKNDNRSVSIVLFSILVGFSIVLSVNIFGDSTQNELFNDIKYFAYSFVIYIAFLLLLLNNFLDKIFFSSFDVKKEIEDDNIIKITIYSTVKLSIIILITFTVYSGT